MKILSIISIGFFLLIGSTQFNLLNNNLIKTKSLREMKVDLSKDKTFTFEKYETGKIPIGWSQYFTGKGESTDWKVISDQGNQVLAQLSNHQPHYHFNEIVFDDLQLKNVELQVRLKGVEGKIDQGGGFVWRFTDANNYYVVRANPLEDNVVLYKVENGIRTDLPLIGKGKTYGVNVSPLGSGWNVLKLTVIDDIFTVYLNGKQLFQVKDKTFTKKGKIGLWTKADAVSYFDDFHIVNLN